MFEAQIASMEQDRVENFHNNVSIAQQHLMEAQLDLDNLGYSAERSEHELICLTNYSQAWIY